MANIIFYEKPGCRNNTRQKKLLKAAGHTLVEKDLLAEPWTEARLRLFFEGYPVSEWFNRAASQIKSGEINPDIVTKEEAMQYMLVEPLLIRRPLMQSEGQYRIGFQQEAVDKWIGLTTTVQLQDMETCQQDHDPCAQHS